MFRHLFISYARGDGEEFARRLHNDLEKLGFTAWLDVYDIPTGADFDAAIDNGLANARAVLVVMTPGAVASLQVKSEWYDAINRYLPVIPLLVQECQVPRVLRVFNFMKFIGNYEAGFQELINAIEQLGNNHLQYLKQTLRAFETAQQESADPRRFKTKITDLREIIGNWEQRFQSQSERISSGLERTKQEIIENTQTPTPRHALRVIGQRPLDVTEFFKDRIRERENIHQLLGDERTRLVTVIGRGGMGKTAVATKVIGEIEQENWSRTDKMTGVDGITYLSTKTAGITMERIFHDCAQMLNADMERQLLQVWANTGLALHDKVTKLLDAFKHGTYIVLLDNMEDLLNESGEITDADVGLFLDTNLTTPNTLRLIVTSRIPLSLRREVAAFDKQVHLMDGLPVPDGVQLLRDLDPNGNYGLLDTLDEDLHAIATMTRGVPRALEVVVALLANDPFTSVNDILSEFFQREDVVKELIEENYKRLDRPSRRVLEALSVFGRPVTQVAVDFLLAPFEQGLEVPAILRRLINTHIVNVDRAAKTVSLHPIDQDYAYSQIPDGPRQEQLYTHKSLDSRAADYYAQIKVHNDNWTTINEIQPQLWEIEHRLKAEEYDRAAMALYDIDHRMASRGLAAKAKALREMVAGKIGDRRLQMLHELRYAELCQMLGLLEEGAASSRNAVELARELDDKYVQLHAILLLSESLRFLGYLDEAERHAEEAEALSDAVDDSYLHTRLYWALAIIATYKRQYLKSLKYNQLMLDYATRNGDTEQIAFAHNSLGISNIVLKRFDNALYHSETALRLYTEVNHRDAIIYVNNMLGMIRLGQGKVDGALADFNRGLVIAQEDNNLRPAGLCLYNLARAYRLVKEPNKALDQATKSAEILQQIGANYAGAAQQLADAIRAGLAQEQLNEAQALLACARETSVNPDFYDPVELAQEALQIAASKGFDRIADEARTFIASMTIEVSEDSEE